MKRRFRSSSESEVRRCTGPVSRRGFLQIGGVGFGGLAFSDLLRLRAEAAKRTESASANSPREDTAVIFIWLPGGPPHMETYDMKPEISSDYRGEFRPIPTVVPGMEICELLPMQAKVADRFTLIRSVAHKFADHGGGHKRFLTGRIPQTPTGFVNDAPAVGSIISKMLEGRRSAEVPTYVSGTNRGRHRIDTYSFGSAYLGPTTHPFVVAGDPSDPDFKIDNLALAPELSDRLDDRITLLNQFDRMRASVDRSGVMDAMDTFNQKAVHLLTSPQVKEAFDLSDEPEALKQRYGKHAWGHRALLARRLVERGSSFVTMVMENPYQSGNKYLSDGTYNWDSHAVNCHIFNDARARMPIFDRAISALIEDLYDRGLDKRVLLVVTGEFGRTPRITYSNNRPGRDHWPNAMSILVSGGGMRTGQIVGSTNARGEEPKDRPLTPNDLWATVYRHLGIDYDQTFPDHSGRPMPILPFGKPIEELL